MDNSWKSQNHKDMTLFYPNLSFVTKSRDATIKLNFLAKFCLIYTGFIGSWFVLWLFTGDKFWWMMALNRFGPYLFLPIPIIFVAVLVVKKPKLVLLLLPPLLIFCGLYWPYITPQFVSSPQSPDLIALQEVQPDMMASLQMGLEKFYPYSFMGIENDWGTIAIFSRYPILQQTSIDLINDHPVTIVMVQVEHEVITFSSVHLRPYVLQAFSLPEIPGAIKQRTQEQNHQAKMLLKTLETYSDSVIIACDCNSTELSGSYRILKKSMRNASREVGWQIRNQGIGTSPDLNLRHIDFVLYRGDFEPTATFLVGDMGGSDHKPLVADFVLIIPE